jgi:hypothetical protein
MSYFRLLICSVSVFYWFGCATYQDRIRPGVDYAVTGKMNDAVQHFASLAQDKSSRDRLAHLLEYGTILQMAGRYKESSLAFIEADRLSEQLDFVSVSQTTMSALSSEEMIDYKGESFEKIMINAMNAINFIALNDMDSALVEIRRIDEKVKKFQRDNREDYEFNPFGTYLSGLIYESLQKWDDAYIAYLKTAKMRNASNPFLLADLNRVALLSGRQSFLEKEGYYQKDLERPNLMSPGCESKKNCGRLNIIFLQGWGPIKKPSFQNPRFPTLMSRRSQTRSLSVSLQSDLDKIPRSFQTQSVYNVEEAAIKTLVADQSALAMRRLGGFVAKEVVADQIRQKDELLGFIAWLTMHLSDRADLRQWSLLPETIQILKVDLPEGDWEIHINGINSQRAVSESFESRSISIKKNKTQFLVLRSKK